MNRIILALTLAVTLAAVAQKQKPGCQTYSCCLNDPNGCGILDLKQPATVTLAHPLRLTGL